MCITTPLVPETPDELAARIRGLTPHLDTLAAHSGVLGAHAAQVLAAELAYIAGRVERGLGRRATRTPSRHPMEGQR